MNLDLIKKADVKRFGQVIDQVDLNMPLGSGAIAGNPFHVNRAMMAHELGFKDVTPNSIYAVSDRDNISNVQLSSTMSYIQGQLFPYR